jgi:GNAT superfamily N-acetyltransferase
MRIRLASVEDASGLAALSDQLGYPSSVSHARAFLIELTHVDNHAIFVAESEAGSITGWVHVFRTRRVFSGAFAELGGLIVDERHRGAGVGAKLLEAAEDWTRKAGCQVLRVRTNVVREQAHAFYQGLGYSVVKSQKVFEKALT